MNSTWREHASCATRPDINFHPQIGRGQAGKGKRSAGDLELLARECCAECPVQKACLEHAIEHHEHGIWGGTNDEERRTERRNRRRRQGA